MTRTSLRLASRLVLSTSGSVASCTRCQLFTSSPHRITLPPLYYTVAPSWSIRYKSTSSTAPEVLDIDKDVDVRLASLRMAHRDRILADQAASSTTDTADLGRQLKELEPIRQIWDEFIFKRKQLISTTNMITSDSEEDMRSLALEEIPVLQKELEVIRAQMEGVLLGPATDSIETTADGAIMELRPGVGGQESTLFVSEVARMYTKFCENKPEEDWAVEMLSSISVDVSTSSGGGSGAGLKEAILQVKGKGAFKRLQYEAGVHRVQRVPLTQSIGKLQSSTIAIVVLPVSSNSEEMSKADDVVDPKDVKTEVMRSRGAGGQHVNKTESAIRLTHEPTGITVSMQDSRSQHQNRVKAWAVLRARLLDIKMRQEVEGNRAKRLAQVTGMDRSDRVRTYNFPQDRVTDHRINLSLSDIDSIMQGEHEPGTGLSYMISELESESKRRKLHALLEEAQTEHSPPKRK